MLLLLLPLLLLLLLLQLWLLIASLVLARRRVFLSFSPSLFTLELLQKLSSSESGFFTMSLVEDFSQVKIVHRFFLLLLF